MKKLYYMIIVLMTAINVNVAFAQLEEFDPILSETARDGHINYDWHFMPTKTDWQRMNLKGRVRTIGEYHNSKSSLTGGEWTDTIRFNQDGLIEAIIAPKKDPFNPNIKFKNTIVNVSYDNGKPIRLIKGEDVEMMNGIEYRVKVINFGYTDRGELLTETNQYFTNKTGKLKVDSWQPTGSNWKYSYNIDNQIATGTTGDGADNAIYKNGLLVDWKYAESNLKPTHFTYDANGLIVAISRFWCEESCAETYYQITRNEKGDIIKVISRDYKTNSKGTRYPNQKPRIGENYTVTYTYDAHNNWTKAVVTSIYSGKRNMFYTITRNITYFE